MEPKDELTPESEQPKEQTTGNESIESSDTGNQRPNEPKSTSKKSRKKLITVIAIAVLVVLITGGAVFAYFWHQNPEKMVADAFANVAKAKSVTYDGSATFTQQADDGEGGKMAVSFSGRSTENRAEIDGELTVAEMGEDGQEVSVQGSMVVAGDDGLFFKVANIREALTSASGGEQIDEGVVNLLEERLSDRWIKLDDDSYQGFTAQFEEQRQCLNDTAKAYSEDEQHNQLADVYRNNRVFTVERTGNEDIDDVSSDRFELSVDEEKIDDFASAFNETKFVKAVNECTDKDIFEGLKEALQGLNEDSVKLELWVSVWSHELTQLRVTGADDEASGEMLIRTKFTEDALDIETPRNATPLKSVMDELMGAFFNYSMQQQSTGSSSGVETEINQDLMLDLNTN